MIHYSIKSAWVVLSYGTLNYALYEVVQTFEILKRVSKVQRSVALKVFSINDIFSSFEIGLFGSHVLKTLTLSKEWWRSGVRTGLSAVRVGVDWGVGAPVVCISGLHVSSSLGTVEVNIPRMHRHALSHISGVNREPLETTRFSKQLVPDLASCSLSEEWKENNS